MKEPKFGSLPTVNQSTINVVINEDQKRSAARYVVARYIDDLPVAKEIISTLGLSNENE